MGDLLNAFSASTPIDWQYIAEGALNLALTYKGKDSQLNGYVLRVRKLNPEASGSSDNPWAESLKFGDSVVVPLLGRRYVQPAVEASLPQGFMEYLATLIENDRPEKRRLHPLDTSLKTALLMLDNTQIPDGEGPSICFELKVKCGFIPSECPFITHDVKKRVDRFTMHQTLKYSSGKLDTLSRYSPVELFSYDKIRVANVLDYLVATPQNNFRMFVNGSMVYPDENGHGSPEAFKGVVEAHNIPGGADSLLDVLSDIFIKEPLLDRIRSFQMMDDCDIEGTWPVYEQIAARGETLSPLSGPVRPRNLPTCLPTTKDEQHELVNRFLLSCTGKDCSTMIAMKPHLDASGLEAPSLARLPVELDGPRTIVAHKGFLFSTAVVDLDPKPIEKMEYYFKEDRKIALFYAQLESQGKLPFQ